jgi:hypothetical protein
MVHASTKSSRLHGFAVLMALRVGEEAWLMMLGD